jgi:NDP-sugar pyrophosphorylase family protein
MTTSHTLVVMAAGIGSRYGGLKQVEPVGPNGEILLDYSIFDAHRAGFDRFVFVVRREIEADLRSRLEKRWANLTCDYVYQELTDTPAPFAAPAGRAKPWGTGHAVYACRKIVTSPFGVINADDFYGAASFRLLAQNLAGLAAESSDAALIGFRLRNTLSEHGPVSRGVCEVDQERRLRRIVEHANVEDRGGVITSEIRNESLRLTGDEVVSMNLWGFAPRWFAHFEYDFQAFLKTRGADPKAEFMLPAVVDRVIREGIGTVRVAVSPERWMGVTYPQDRAAVAAGISDLIARGVYPPALTLS